MSSTRPKPLPRAQQLSDDSAELIYRLKHPHIEERHSYHHMVPPRRLRRENTRKVQKRRTVRRPALALSPKPPRPRLRSYRPRARRKPPGRAAPAPRPTSAAPATRRSAACRKSAHRRLPSPRPSRRSRLRRSCRAYAIGTAGSSPWTPSSATCHRAAGLALLRPAPWAPEAPSAREICAVSAAFRGSRHAGRQ